MTFLSNYVRDLTEFHERGRVHGLLEMRSRVTELLMDAGMLDAASAVVRAFPADSILQEGAAAREPEAEPA